jgi:ligand-binding SRPBCC domain-containing protein
VGVVPRIVFETLVHAPAEVCFDVGLDVDLHAAAFAPTGERAVAGVTHGKLSLGECVTWEAVHFGIRQRLTTQITQYERPHSFQDEMVRGAFHAFWHRHVFTPVDAGTVVLDDFVYEAPLGPLGHLADALFLERYVERLLRASSRNAASRCAISPLLAGLVEGTTKTRLVLRHSGCGPGAGGA